MWVMVLLQISLETITPINFIKLATMFILAQFMY